jgi:HSP20 family molecular chaperone IbpA
VEAELPGVTKDRVAVEVTKENALRIGVREEEKGNNEGGDSEVRKLLWEMGSEKVGEGGGGGIM